METPLDVSLDDLIMVAYMNKARRYKVARQLRYLKEVDVEKLLKFVDIIAEDPESIEFSELGESLAKLLEKLEEEDVNNIVNKLTESEKGLLLLAIALSITRKKINEDIFFEVLRRMLTSDNENIRNGGISILKSWADRLDKAVLEDLLLEMLNSGNVKVIRSLLLAVEMISRYLPLKFINDLVERVIVEYGKEVEAELIYTLEVLKGRLGKKQVEKLKLLLSQISQSS